MLYLQRILRNHHALHFVISAWKFATSHSSARESPLPSGLGQARFVRRRNILDGKKQTIFTWFKNKAAVQAWYSSKMHKEAMAKFFPNMPGGGETLAGFKDDKAPLLVVATVMPSEKLVMQGSALKAEQIVIEIYTPVPGGLTIGGGFGPKAMEVPGMIRIED